jgi:hypothetical protein
MTTFRATPEDLTGVIREHQRGTLRRSLPYPAAALLFGLSLLQIDRTLAAFALGMAAAWAWSTVQELRAVRPTVLWTYAWLQEDITVTTDEEGLRMSSARGASFLRWDGGTRVQSRADFFLIKDEEDDLAILPKKYLTEAELLALNSHAGRQG